MNPLAYRTKCHPEAGGRTPEPSDLQYTLHFPLEDGRQLQVAMGQAGFEHFSQFVLDMLADRPSYGEELDKPPVT